MKKRAYGLSALLCCLLSARGVAGETPSYESDESIRQRLGVGHHGGAIMDCTPPTFFQEVPANEAKVDRFQDFSLAASDNTEADTVRVWVNNEATPVAIEVERSGRLKIRGTLEKPITSGKAWIRVKGYSNEGCDQLYVWNVYIGG